jgi:hypothetical protein
MISEPMANAMAANTLNHHQLPNPPLFYILYLHLHQVPSLFLWLIFLQPVTSNSYSLHRTFFFLQLLFRFHHFTNLSHLY